MNLVHLEKVHELSLKQGLHLAYSLQLPAHVVNSILADNMYILIHTAYMVFCALPTEGRLIGGVRTGQERCWLESFCWKDRSPNYG